MKPRKLSLEELQERARTATQIALMSRSRIPELVPLTLGTFWDEPCVIFELYVARDKPSDAIVLTRARVNMYDGRIEAVTVFDEVIQKVAEQAA
jgi:hypothetical protein